MVTASRWLTYALVPPRAGATYAGEQPFAAAAGMARGAARGESNQAARANASKPSSKG